MSIFLVYMVCEFATQGDNTTLYPCQFHVSQSPRFKYISELWTLTLGY